MMCIIVSQCNSFSQLSQFSKLVFRKVSHCWKNCFANHVSQVLQIRVTHWQGFANTNFVVLPLFSKVFRKYKFRSFTFVSQGFARFRKYKIRTVFKLEIGFFVSQGLASFARFLQWAVCWCRINWDKMSRLAYPRTRWPDLYNLE